jgi:hypothetical protein
MMRQAMIGWALLASSTILGCGEDAEPSVHDLEPTAADSQPVFPSEHDGTVVMAGQYPVEVVPHASGEVYAYVLGEAPGPETVELTVAVPVRGRQTGRPVRMRWDPGEERYVGRVRRLAVVPGPIDVTIVVGGAAYYGHVDVCVVFPAIEVRVRERRGKFKRKHKHRRGRIDIRFR